MNNYPLEFLFSTLLGKYLGVELLGHMIIFLFSFLRTCHTVFQLTDPCSKARIISIKAINSGGFPGGAVVRNPPANAGNTGLSPGPGGSHMSVHLEPVLRNKRGHHNEKPMHHNEK